MTLERPEVLAELDEVDVAEFPPAPILTELNPGPPVVVDCDLCGDTHEETGPCS